MELSEGSSFLTTRLNVTHHQAPIFSLTLCGLLVDRLADPFNRSLRAARSHSSSICSFAKRRGSLAVLRRDKLFAGNKAPWRQSLKSLSWGVVLNSSFLWSDKHFEVPTRYFVGTFCLIVVQLIAAAKSGSTARLTASSSFGLTLSGAAGSCRTVTCCPAISSVSSTS